MQRYFHCIGIVGNTNHPHILETHAMLYNWLKASRYEVIVEKKIADLLSLKNTKHHTLEDIGKYADLAIVVGGDGNMLGAARVLAYHDIKVIGVNRGNLGFLTDINPNNMKQQLNDVLNGHFYLERRFLLEVQLYKSEDLKDLGRAVNEVIIHSGKIAHMIEFEVYIDDIFAFSQRSDGLIISTPTGSTAYSFSAGGPILTPSLNAISLVPMFPHTLSSRVLVIGSQSRIRLRFSSLCSNLKISCDSQITIPIDKDEEVLIHQSEHFLNLIHPKNYDYFHTLSSKLGWAKNIPYKYKNQ
ncbi:NAD(+) kinase [Candidatus Ishikawella capsulata]|uniref:NAD kinase n=1 Tax=Candidatus Ishikawaella capsulata Mpkobe TaxID=476281 RepID=C5WDA3_9ENTR|nr:NAD(+) kinase [Candidatus Ishikawaella capsulata]BAH83309.1 inorganic polyphosphate/ATP-NAD kinase [Candidatus Ishikawaella capsulata Mpkobe]